MMIDILIMGHLPTQMLEKFVGDTFRLHRPDPNEDVESFLQEEGAQFKVILSSFSAPVTQNIMDYLPNLQIISNYGVGYDNIDVHHAHSRGIVVTNTPDLVTDDTADIAMGLMIAVGRRMVEADLYVRLGKWLDGGFPLATKIAGKKVGIVGLGRIGKAIAKRCTGFDMDISYFGRNQQADQPFKYFTSLTDMAKHVDFLIVSCAGGKETHNLVNHDVVKALGQGSHKGFLINVSRGSVVDEQALVEALYNNQIAGAALDVFENEPHVPEALTKMDNVVLLPHIGTATVETRSAMATLVYDNVESFFRTGKALTPV